MSPGIIAKWGGIKGYPPVVSGFTGGNPIYKADDGTIINTVGTLTRPWYGDDKARTGYVCAKKWRDPNLTGNYNGPDGKGHIFGDQNQILMRYAEVILSRAECKVRNGDVAGAMADLKLVRDRAWGGTAPAVMQDSADYKGDPGSLLLILYKWYLVNTGMNYLVNILLSLISQGRYGCML